MCKRSCLSQGIKLLYLWFIVYCRHILYILRTKRKLFTIEGPLKQQRKLWQINKIWMHYYRFGVKRVLTALKQIRFWNKLFLFCVGFIIESFFFVYAWSCRRKYIRMIHYSSKQRGYMTHKQWICSLPWHATKFCVK